jgi:inorganic pyrophosphatase
VQPECAFKPTGCSGEQPSQGLRGKEQFVTRNPSQPLWTLLNVLYKPHPWHGISPGDGAPEVVQCFIELVPTDTVKYEIDKVSGYLRVDRPQKYSNVCPALYGFIPQTFCGDSVAALSAERTGLTLAGDGDPVDVCVLTDRQIEHGNLLLECIPVGGFRMIDGNEVDDKLIAVLKDDATFGQVSDITEISNSVLDRLRHYFLTYKQAPGDPHENCRITHTYGRLEAQAVIRHSFEDYRQRFGDLESILSGALSVTVGQASPSTPAPPLVAQ